jgi:large repetitive protein
MHTGNTFRIAGAVATAVALLGCGDHTRTSGARSAPSRGTAAVPLVPPTPAQRAIAAGTTPLAIDEDGLPRLLRGADAIALPAATPAKSAALHVARLASTWGVQSSALPQLAPIADVALLGGTVSRLRQIVDGIPVDGGELRVMTRPDGTLVAASGILRSTSASRVAASWSFGETGAIARALRAKYRLSFDASRLVARHRTTDGSVFSGRSGNVDVSLARARKVWHATSRSPDATLIAAWAVEASANSAPATSTSSDAFRMVIAADDGRVLDERNLIADADFTYRVFAETTGEMHPADGPIVDSTPHPTGQPAGTFPAYATSALVTVNGLNHPGTSPSDPWLAAGKTETIGNNVEAYADFNAPDGLTFGDFRATTTAAGKFDRTYDFAVSPMSTQAQQMAGITSLFFTINWMHDFWYDGGFTESAGNGQNANYGRGGEDRDAILAEAQDNALGGSRNNANMFTPDDGLPPRMQVFLWGGKETRTLTFGARSALSGTAAFGPTNFDVTADMELANDGVGTATDACTALPAATGKIVLVDRGSCTFKTKALNVQNAGGVGVIIANNAVTTAPPGLGDDPTITTPITIPTLSILQSEGTQLKTDMAAGTVSATMHREVGVDLEGTLDASVVAHEFGHYLHHRLSLCTTTFCGAMSEGWADFSSLLMIARDGDNFMGAYPVGIYSTQSFSADPAYYGIRRAPYSADHTINDLSFRHMADGEATPTSHPFRVIANNAEVHNAGEVWSAMLWEAYVALQQGGPTFDAVRLKMRQYVVAGLLIAPPDATPTETRDAILIATRAVSQADHDTLAAAFARRGFGSCAKSPARTSTTFVGIVESSLVKGNGVLGAAEMALATSCDTDQVLDAGETAKVTVPIANTGPTALTNAVATLATTTAGVTVTSQPVAIGTLGPYGSTMATFDIAVGDTVVAPTAADFTITLTSSDGCAASVEQPISVTVNTDDMLASSATDSFDAIGSVWTPPTTDSAWTHTRPTPLDGIWFGADRGTRGDSSLTSPALTGDATGPVTITFSHKFSFEANATQVFDGGVIEISSDNGVTWVDIATMVTPSPYNTTLTTTSDNPLPGRAAFGRTNAMYPNPDTVTLALGTQLTGKTFQIRFRVVTDSGTSGPGWEIDDLAVTGIVGTPFPTLVADMGMCAGPAPDAGVVMPDAEVPPMPDAGGNPDTGDGGGCCQSQRSPAGSGILALAVIGLIGRRRRRS